MDHQPQAIGSTGLKQNDETGEDEQTVIDLTNKVNKDHTTKCHEKLSQESCISFSGTINTDTRTIEVHYNTTNSTVLGAPKTVGSSSLDELHNRLDEQARLLNEQQKAIHGIQHLQKQVAPNTRPDSFPH